MHKTTSPALELCFAPVPFPWMYSKDSRCRPQIILPLPFPGGFLIGQTLKYLPRLPQCSFGCEAHRVPPQGEAAEPTSSCFCPEAPEPRGTHTSEEKPITQLLEWIRHGFKSSSSNYFPSSWRVTGFSFGKGTRRILILSKPCPQMWAMGHWGCSSPRCPWGFALLHVPSKRRGHAGIRTGLTKAWENKNHWWGKELSFFYVLWYTYTHKTSVFLLVLGSFCWLFFF